MSKAVDPQDEIVRTNLGRFRTEAKLTQADAAELSGVPLDNLRRYESGAVTNVPSTVLRALALAYGHAMDDFFLADPPPANLSDAPVFFLRTRPGAQVDAEVYAKVRAAIDEANDLRGRKAASKKPRAKP